MTTRNTNSTCDRVLAKPNVVGRFDTGYEQDGVNCFVGLELALLESTEQETELRLR